MFVHGRYPQITRYRLYLQPVVKFKADEHDCTKVARSACLTVVAAKHAMATSQPMTLARSQFDLFLAAWDCILLLCQSSITETIRDDLWKPRGQLLGEGNWWSWNRVCPQASRVQEWQMFGSPPSFKNNQLVQSCQQPPVNGMFTGWRLGERLRHSACL